MTLHRTARRRHRQPAIALLLGSTLVLGASGLSGALSTASAAPVVSSIESPTSDVSLSKAAGVAQASAIVARYRQPPAFIGPTTPVSIGKLKGKKVVYISVSNSIPVLKYWSDKLTKLLAQYGGVQMTVIDAKGSVDTANTGFKEAIATKANAIVLQALPAKLFAAQIKAAHAAGIKVITANSGIPGDVSGGQDAEVSFDYVQVGKLIGDWMVQDSKGTGKGLEITSNDVPASQPQAQGTLSEVKRLCPGCNMESKDVQIPQWQTSIPTLFQTTINSDPSRKYLFPLYDGQALPGLGAIRSAGAGTKVDVGAFNATPGIVQQLKDPKSGLKLEIGGQNEWWAYAATDEIFRVLAGAPVISNYHVGLRIFDATNSKLIQGNDEYSWYQSPAYRTKFPALWKS